MAAYQEPMRMAEGGCACRQVRYQISGTPLYVNCCHCRWCQRETGSAFVINAMYEADRVWLLSGEVRVINTPSESGRGQRIARCPECYVALWSNYSQAGDGVRFVRAGTLDAPDAVPPDVHIFVSSKQPWVQLPGDVPAFAGFYNPKQQWSPQTLERFAALRKSAPRAPGPRT